MSAYQIKELSVHLSPGVLGYPWLVVQSKMRVSKYEKLPSAVRRINIDCLYVSHFDHKKVRLELSRVKRISNEDSQHPYLLL